jgi:hypothetical protein
VKATKTRLERLERKSEEEPHAMVRLLDRVEVRRSP